MNRTIYPVLMTAALLLTGLVMTGCKHDNNAPEQPARVQTYRMRITASKGADTPTNGLRRVLSLDGTTLNAVWATGEQVSVYNVTKGAALNGHLEAQSGGASTQLEGELTGTVEAGDILTLRFLSPTYTDQQGTLAYISANCDYAVAENVEVASVSGGQIQAANDAVFANQQAIIRFTLKDAADGTTPLNPTAFAVNDGTSDIATLTSIPASTYAANGDGVLYAAVPGFSGKTITLTATVGADTYIYTKPNVTIDNGSYYTLSAEAVKQASAANRGFSVSATQKVIFAPGNLQYNAALGSHQCADGTTKQGTWRFAEHQWDMVGMGYGQTSTGFPYYCEIGGTVTDGDNRQASSSYNGWIDLFGWGTSGWESGAVCYQPWSTSLTNSDYYPGGSYTNSLTGAYANADWGVYNEISEDAPGTWRTLTSDEWEYLFHGRANYAGLFGLGTVNGVQGTIILPDNWESVKPSGLTFTPSTSNGLSWQGDYYRNSNGTNYSDNTYTLEQWEKKMETAGAVFLPAAGGRYGMTVLDAGSGGNYWSSTQYDSDYAYYLDFYPVYLYPQYSYYRSRGYSVRLVQVLMN